MGYYLLDRPNPNAPVRANGVRYWGYPTRLRRLRMVVMHIPVAPYVSAGPDPTAENIARYFATTSRPVSAHACIDADSVVECLPPSHTAFHVRGYNSSSYGVEHGYGHLDWGRNRDRDYQIIDRTGRHLAPIVAAAAIPLRLITRTEADRKVAGFTGHNVLDPERRKDPGPNYPWELLFERIDHHTKGTNMADIDTVGTAPGVDPELSVAWEWAGDDLRSEHTKADGVIRPEQLMTFFHRYHHSMVLPEIAKAIKAADATSATADKVARELAGRALEQLRKIGAAAKG